MTRRNSSEKTSRRSFAKSVAGSLIAVPFASSLVSASQPKFEDIEPTTTDSVESMIGSPLVFKEHIPPFIISDGSLEVEAHGLGNNPQQNPNTVPPGSIPRGFKYTGEIGGKYNLSRVKLIAIYENVYLVNDVVRQVDYNPTTLNSVVKISLEREISSGGSYNPVDQGKPQIVIKSERVVPNKTNLIMESHLNLGNGKRTHKTDDFQRKKYGHPGFGNDILFRINKVEVNDVNLFMQLPQDDAHKERYKVIVMVWIKPDLTP